MRTIKLAIIGLGPFSWSCYLQRLNNLELEPALVIDLDSKAKVVETVLKANEYTNTEVLLIPHQLKDELNLPIPIQSAIVHELNRLKITHVILSTEPKAHFAYLSFLKDLKIAILVDKPLYALKNRPKSAKEKNALVAPIYQALTKKTKAKIYIHASRRLRPAVLLMLKAVKELTRDYNLPISVLEISYSGGLWMLPSEYLTRENHPFKYGYGMHFHSGFHFIDLVAIFLESNGVDLSNPKYTVKVKSSLRYPIDDVACTSLSPGTKKRKIKNHVSLSDFNAVMGEVDASHVLEIYENHILRTLVSLNLMTGGFTNRKDDKIPLNTYGSMGRVRHERVVAHLSPAATFQFHEYQLKKVKDTVDLVETPIWQWNAFYHPQFKKKNFINYSKESILMKKNKIKGSDIFLDFLNVTKSASEFVHFKSSFILFEKVYDSILENQIERFSKIE